MNNYGKVAKTTSLLVLSAAIAACGGSGGSSGGGNGPGGGDSGGGGGSDGGSVNVVTQMPEDVSGFAVTGNEEALYFTQVKGSPQDGSGLYMVESVSGQPQVEDVDVNVGIGFHDVTDMDPSNMRFISRHENTFFTLFEADGSAGDMENLRSSLLFYADGSEEDHLGNGYRRVMVSPDHLVRTPEMVTNAKKAPQLQPSRQVLHDLNDAGRTCLLDPTDNFNKNWKQICLNHGMTTPPGQLFDMRVFAATLDPQAMNGEGYLAIDDDNVLRFIGRDLQNLGPVLDADTGSPVTDIMEAADLRMRSTEGHQYVVLYIEDRDHPEVWLYETDAAGAGTVKRVTSAEGEPLLMGHNVANVLQIPDDRNVTVMNGETFFLYADVEGDITSSSVNLIRLSGDTWSIATTIEGGAFMGGTATTFLMNAGGHLVVESNEADGGKEVIALLPDGSGRKVMDARGNGVFQLKFDRQPVLGTSANGEWLFYNRFEDKSAGETQWSPVAVALNPATNERLDMAGWTWVGASSNGKGSLDMRHGSETLAQVFMIGPNTELAALQADDPMAGKVNFGALPDGVTAARFNGVGPGPRRLLWAMSNDDDEEDYLCVWSQCTYDVLYLDVRDEGSLQLLTESSSSHLQSPLPKF